MPARSHGFAAATLLCTLAVAQDIHVDAARGSDANTGTPTSPVRSITRGVSLAGTASSVFVYAGTYGPSATGEILPIGIGTLGNQQGIVLRGLGSVLFDAAGAGGAAFKIGPNASGGRITNFTFQNMSATDWYARVIEAGSYRGSGSATGFEIDRCIFENVNRGILIWENTPAVTGWKIHSNLFRSLTNDGVNDFFAQSSNEIFHNTFAGNLHLAITTDGSTSRIYHNVITGSRVGIGAGPTQVAANFVANDVWQCQIPWQGIATPPGNLAVDPLFVNASQGDFHLLAASPLIDAAPAPAFARADLDANSRVIDANVDGSILADLGAYESSPLKTTGTYAGTTLSFSLTTSNLGVTVAVLGFALEDGITQVPFWSPILLDPASIFLTVAGPFPLSAVYTNVVLPPGLPLVVQGLGFAPISLGFVPGNQVRIQI